MSGAMDPMTRLESGGNPAAVNRRTGATGLRQFLPPALQSAGVYQPAGPDGWAGVFNIPGFAQVRNRADFMANPAAQEAAYAAHQANLRREIAARGLARFVGQTIGGRAIAEDDIMHGMHFAGPGGMTRYLSTGGAYDPSDGHLRVSQYLARLGGGALPPSQAPVMQQATPPPVPARPSSPEEEWLRVFRPVSPETPLVFARAPV
jgi:hypothetical protein